MSTGSEVQRQLSRSNSCHFSPSDCGATQNNDKPVPEKHQGAPCPAIAPHLYYVHCGTMRFLGVAPPCPNVLRRRPRAAPRSAGTRFISSGQFACNTKTFWLERCKSPHSHEYGLKVAATVVAFRPLSESSDGPLHPSSDILFLPKRPATRKHITRSVLAGILPVDLQVTEAVQSTLHVPVFTRGEVDVLGRWVVGLNDSGMAEAMDWGKRTGTISLFPRRIRSTQLILG
ncbi:hypothetical protein EVAR_40780_1 [Eumeta japonica]|uniref:Uncharacterized protein n=1 Tax=Eumeta variegata TaxID=151549 RepID=A0A4C1X2J5_EUMVA|nr:hypothetical protein EVAR_40780_1 [Eumeta japonica]